MGRKGEGGIGEGMKQGVSVGGMGCQGFWVRLGKGKKYRMWFCRHQTCIVNVRSFL